MRRAGSSPGTAGERGGTTSRRRLLPAGLALVGLIATGPVLGAGPFAGASPAGAAAATGTVGGHVSITNAPAVLVADVGAYACPASTPKGRLCAHPATDTVGQSAPFRLDLAPGSWRITPYYSLPPYGGLFTTGGTVVTVTQGGLVLLQMRVPYRSPGTVSGSVSVTGMPAGVSLTRVSVLACPKGDPYRGGRAPVTCVREWSGASGGSGVETQAAAPAGSSGATGTPLPASSSPAAASPSAAAGSSGSYRLTTLPPGKWLLYPGYSTVFGSPTSGTGTLVTVTASATTGQALTMAYQPPTHGAAQGTAWLNDAPADFQGAVGVAACTSANTDVTDGSSCPLAAFTDDRGTYSVAMRPGHWWLVPFYVDFSRSGGPVPGTPVGIDVTAGVVTPQDLAVDYAG